MGQIATGILFMGPYGYIPQWVPSQMEPFVSGAGFGIATTLLIEALKQPDPTIAAPVMF